MSANNRQHDVVSMSMFTADRRQGKGTGFRGIMPSSFYKDIMRHLLQNKARDYCFNKEQVNKLATMIPKNQVLIAESSEGIYIVHYASFDEKLRYMTLYAQEKQYDINNEQTYDLFMKEVRCLYV